MDGRGKTEHSKAMLLRGYIEQLPSHINSRFKRPRLE